MTDQKNTLLAIVLSLIVLVGWQYFYGLGQVHQPPKGPPNQQTQQAPTGGANAPVAVPGQAPNAAAPNGVSGDGRKSTAEIGKVGYDMHVDEAVAQIRLLLSTP